ncbi:hypothetical protein F4779DRAFT_620177 [Xylariaceae sp. FL0662B]|nr:hypothetical protein F4779DRAFT_620177 [Xylariaceae sp. FL0662B]
MGGMSCRTNSTATLLASPGLGITAAQIEEVFKSWKGTWTVIDESLEPADDDDEDEEVIDDNTEDDSSESEGGGCQICMGATQVTRQFIIEGPTDRKRVSLVPKGGLDDKEYERLVDTVRKKGYRP